MMRLGFIKTKENLRKDNDTAMSSLNKKEDPLCKVTDSSSDRRTLHQGPCPCCNRLLSSSKQQIEITKSHGSITDVNSEITNDSSNDDLDETGRMLPGLLATGIAYTVKSIIAQGSVNKKGSGFDWIGSRAWKKRFAVLVVRKS